MLIAISGSQGLGKSVLIEELKTWDFVKTIDRKTSRSILSDWGVSLSEVNNDRQLTLKFQDEILTRKQHDESIAMMDPKSVWVTERSYADLFTYAAVSIGKDNECSSWLDEYHDRCVAAQKSYYQVFYLTNAGRWPGEVQNDGVRAINKHYATLVDLTMSHYTATMTPNRVTPISHGDLQLRCAVIKAALNRN